MLKGKNGTTQTEQPGPDPLQAQFSARQQPGYRVVTSKSLLCLRPL